MQTVLEVITPATTYDLVTVAEAKIVLGITETTQDALIAIEISAVSELIKAYVGRPFQIETVKELFLAEEAVGALVLERWPVNTISSFALTFSGTVLASNVYILSARNGILYAYSSGRRSLFSREFHSVTYTAGYGLVPGIVKQAAFLALKWYRSLTPDIFGLKSARMEGVATEVYFDNQRDILPKEIQNLLAAYTIR